MRELKDALKAEGLTNAAKPRLVAPGIIVLGEAGASCPNQCSGHGICIPLSTGNASGNATRGKSVQGKPTALGKGKKGKGKGKGKKRKGAATSMLSLRERIRALGQRSGMRRNTLTVELIGADPLGAAGAKNFTAARGTCQ